MTSLPAGRADAYPHAADLALIPFAIGSDPGAAHFVLTPDLTRHDGALYGGTGAAAGTPADGSSATAHPTALAPRDISIAAIRARAGRATIAV